MDRRDLPLLTDATFIGKKGKEKREKGSFRALIQKRFKLLSDLHSWPPLDSPILFLKFLYPLPKLRLNWGVALGLGVFEICCGGEHKIFISRGSGLCLAGSPFRRVSAKGSRSNSCFPWSPHYCPACAAEAAGAPVHSRALQFRICPELRARREGAPVCA